MGYNVLAALTADWHAGRLEDTMESFFLSETTKYLYLLHSNASALAEFMVFSTEGHMFSPLYTGAAHLLVRGHSKISPDWS